LVWDYKEILDEIKPDGFLFENVTGILNINGGQVFNDIKKAFSETIHSVKSWTLSAENYGVPQRRKRVILLGVQESLSHIDPPPTTTSMDTQPNLFGDIPQSVTVEAAISDLPKLIPGEDGSSLGYDFNPTTKYQEFCRGMISSEEYIQSLL
tara:strand:- start:34 stop:489 length:456 start_codon:yes stop_codon:yes gene_type:complete